MNERYIKLLNCFIAELQERPYNKITIADISRKTNISRKSFYRCFYSKQACLLAVIDRHLSASYEVARHGGLQQYFIYWQHNRDFLKMLKANALYPILLEQAMQFVSQRNRQDWDHHQIRFVVTGVLCVIVQWIERGCKESVDYLGKELHKVLTVPLLTLLSNDEGTACFLFDGELQ